MKKIKFSLLLFLLPCILFTNNTHAQITDTIYVGIAAYPYLFGMKTSNGTLAIGPTISLNSGRIQMQLSIIEDLRKYQTSSGLRMERKPEKNTNFYLSTCFNYNYLKQSKFAPFFSGGFILGGQYYRNENNETRKTNGINFLVGTGFSHNLFNYLKLKTSVSLRYSSRIFFPGLFFDIAVPIKVTH